jgi:hypothetical protein
MMSILYMSILAAQDFHEIAPPVDYSLFPTWVIFVATFVGLTILGLLVWWFLRRKQPAPPPKLPRERALEALNAIGYEIDHVTPYQFSIRVSDILRMYVTEQHGLPATRQTSIEFLNAVSRKSPFAPEEKSLLEDFLSRCDLIKFARYDATRADSELLLEEARRFVKGGERVATALLSSRA